MIIHRPNRELPRSMRRDYVVIDDSISSFLFVCRPPDGSNSFPVVLNPSRWVDGTLEAARDAWKSRVDEDLVSSIINYSPPNWSSRQITRFLNNLATRLVVDQLSHYYNGEPVLNAICSDLNSRAYAALYYNSPHGLKADFPVANNTTKDADVVFSYIKDRHMKLGEYPDSKLETMFRHIIRHINIMAANIVINAMLNTVSVMALEAVTFPENIMTSNDKNYWHELMSVAEVDAPPTQEKNIRPEPIVKDLAEKGHRYA